MYSKYSRAELKRVAKNILRRTYWDAFAESLAYSLLGLGVVTILMSIYQVIYYMQVMQSNDPYIMLASMSIWFIFAAIIQLFNLLAGNIFLVGHYRYYIRCREGDMPSVRELFCGFKDGRYTNVLAVMFMKNLFIFLWSLLLLVPGLIKTYSYSMVPYILAENPEMGYREALSESRYLMDGYKWRLFVLELSMLGWRFLAVLAFGLGTPFLNPYLYTVYTEFYTFLKEAKKDQNLEEYY